DHALRDDHAVRDAGVSVRVDPVGGDTALGRRQVHVRVLGGATVVRLPAVVRSPERKLTGVQKLASIQ
ncbi:hypothetical protein, partial [Sinomonas sp.]|uniref:hypothetical protein n=1 Tax=Sinomonas sp. TaxID=1914986 RepID=UPI003F81FBF4